MTYVQFLALFLVPPILALVLVAVRTRNRAGNVGLWWQLPLLAAVAILYTGPWDGSLITQGVWSYPPAQVIGVTVLRVPLEEYGFYVLQVIMTGLLAAVVWRRMEFRSR